LPTRVQNFSLSSDIIGAPKFCNWSHDLTTYTAHLWLVGKRVVDFLLVLIELFSPALTVEAL